MTMTTLPNNGIDVPSWLDKDFLATILRHDEDDPSLSVVHFNVRRAVAKGENNWSLLLRVQVGVVTRNSDRERITSLIVKSRPRGEIVGKWINAVGHFRKEELIYRETLPEMYRLWKEEAGSEGGRFTPKSYSNDRPDTIVLEDLKPLGYKMADRRNGLDLNQSKMALNALAKLHGLSIVLHANKPESLSEFTESLYSENTREMHCQFMVPFYKKLAIEVGTWPGFERFEEKIKHFSDIELDRVIDLIKCKPGSICVLNHGDFWTNNILFRYDGKDIVDAKLIDFQVVRFASPALDIIYFLHTSLSQQVLEDHEDDLVEWYHAALCRILQLLHCPPELFISKEQLMQEMTAKRFFAVVVSCKLCFMLAESAETPDFSSLEEGKVESGVEDMAKIFAGRRFKDAFQRRLLKFESEGLI